MKTKKKRFPTGKLIIGGVAFLFLIYACFLTILWLAGQPVRAKVTSFRREMGERDETIRNKYTYVYSYEFSVDGQTYSGNSKKVQGPVFLKNDGNSFLNVHYLKCCPFLNGPETDFTPKYKLLIYFGIAALLFYFVSKMK
jgi:hypothetical protein